MSLVGIPRTGLGGATGNVILHWRDRNVLAEVTIINSPSPAYSDNAAALLPLVEPAIYPIADLMESRIASAN
jgi:hypothetical protein